MEILGAMTLTLATTSTVRHRPSAATSIALQASGMARGMLRNVVIQRIRKAAASLAAARSMAAIIGRFTRIKERIHDEKPK